MDICSKRFFFASHDFTRAFLNGGQEMYYAVKKCGETPKLKEQAS
jgi:predicted ferric reductase